MEEKNIPNWPGNKNQTINTEEKKGLETKFLLALVFENKFPVGNVYKTTFEEDYRRRTT